MPPRPAPPTWRLLELLPPAARPCPACGQVHRYLLRLTAVGACMVEIDAHLAEPTERAATQDARSRYEQVAERVRRTSLRCEGCGARFEELEVYRVHPCQVHYR